MEQMKVMIAENHEQMRQFLAEIVESEESLTVVGTAKNGTEACEMIRRLTHFVFCA